MVRPAIDARPRRRTSLVLPAVAVAVAAVVAVAVASGSGAPGAGAPRAAAVRVVAEGPAPGFRLPALGPGGPVGLPAPAEPVILSFFASWCEGCQAEMATLKGLEARAGGRVQIIGIDVSDSRGPARALVARNRITYPVAVDAAYRTAEAYRLVGLPTTVYLDARHQVVGRTVGPLTGPVGEAWLAALEGART